MTDYIPKYKNPNYKGYKQFEDDLKIAQVTEKEVADALLKKLGEKHDIELLEYNNDNRYDLKFKFNNKILKVEVKEDFSCERTGNVSVEYSCDGKPSGIEVSEADLYVYKVHLPAPDRGKTELRLISTKTLKRMIKQQNYHRIVSGGDLSSALNYLFYLRDFQKNSVKI